MTVTFFTSDLEEVHSRLVFNQYNPEDVEPFTKPHTEAAYSNGELDPSKFTVYVLEGHKVQVLVIPDLKHQKVTAEIMGEITIEYAIDLAFVLTQP